MRTIENERYGILNSSCSLQLFRFFRYNGRWLLVIESWEVQVTKII